MKISSFRINLEHDISKRNKVDIEMTSLGTYIEKSNDELGFATNWKRPFKKINTMIKWLNAFAIINEIAAHKILKKFMKEHFKIKDNILDKIVIQMLQEFHFVKRANIQPVTKDMKTVYAKLFTKDNLKVAT
jgi:predicted DsbA family dithiol-disulfide isomerase